MKSMCVVVSVLRTAPCGVVKAIFPLMNICNIPTEDIVNAPLLVEQDRKN